MGSNIKRSPDGFCVLDYRLITDILCNGSANEKVSILEGFRWVRVHNHAATPFLFLKICFCVHFQRIVHSPDAERNKTLKDIAHYDLFGMRGTDVTQTRLESLLWPPCDSLELRVQKYAAKLLYTIVSSKLGRDYMRNISIIHLLAWSNSISTPPINFKYRSLVSIVIAEYLVATMAKLCTISFHRDDMMNKGTTTTYNRIYSYFI